MHTDTVVMEACAGAHFMARRIADLGHEAKLISPQSVRPFVKSNKNDFVDAEAICEAASRPFMRFVVRDKVKTTNQMHAFLLEFRISMPIGAAVIKRLPTVLEENELPPYLAQLLMRLHAHYLYLVEQITEPETALEQELSRDETGQRLQTIPGIGPITASVLSHNWATVNNMAVAGILLPQPVWYPGSTARAEKIRFQG